MGNLVFQATLGGQVNLVGPNTASTFNLNVPAVSSTISTTSGTETLTNKTLTTPVINGFTGDTSVVNIGSGQFYKDTSGNLGLGVTPSAWSGAGPVVEVGTSKGNAFRGAGTNDANVESNAYYNSGWKYATTGYANRYAAGNGNTGGHAWYNAASGTAGNAITFTQAMTLDASGNLGVGSTSPNIGGLTRALTLNTPTGGNYSGVELAGAGTLSARFITNNAAGTFIGSQVSIPLIFETNATERARIDSSGNLGIGLTSPSYKLDVAGSARITAGGSADTILGYGANYDNYFTSGASGIQVFRNSSGAERARIDSSGNLLVGSTTSTARIVGVSSGLVGYYRITGVTGDGFQIVQFAGDAGSDNHQFFAANTSGSGNAAATMYKLGKASTGRSINAAGTVNASGADYAEYMTKVGDFTVAKGDVIGINAEGKLTNVFADAVSFVVKSSDPSYVGGDVWGTPQALGLDVPTEESTDQEKETFNTALETARQLVDRIAFAGQVPVNVTGATAGQYIVPVNDNGTIKGQAVSNPTFEQYQQAVGKVIAIEQDGRARIIVKVA